MFSSFGLHCGSSSLGASCREALESHDLRERRRAKNFIGYSQDLQGVSMKKICKAVAVAVGILLATVPMAGHAWAQSLSSSRFCNAQLIRGVYGFTVEGAKLAGPPGTPTGSQKGIAMTEFDGHGGLSQIDAVTVDGTLVSDFTHPLATGTYKVNADCTGNFTLNFTDGRPPVNTSFVVVEGGWEIDTVVTSVGPPGAEQQGIIATTSIGKRRGF
jgi:hypothetical protein